jgi:3-methyladenine DNA glycosylase AlkD
MRRFFKEDIKAHGWRTADVRKLAAGIRRELKADPGSLMTLADELFRAHFLEEKTLAVFLLEKDADTFGEREFRRFETWLNRVDTWADHDALVYGIIGRMLVTEPRRADCVFTWARSRNRWLRRAAAVSLIPGARKKLFANAIRRLTETLLADKDDMVQKGLGWLLREWVKYDAQTAVPFLLEIRDRAPRLVLRTACETLPKARRKMVLC